jgi:hypothetical protein
MWRLLERPNPSLVEEQTQFSNIEVVLEQPDGPETKNHCASEGQQQFTGLDFL